MQDTIKVAGFNVGFWRLPILDNGLGVAEVAETDFDEVGNPVGDRFAW